MELPQPEPGVARTGLETRPTTPDATPPGGWPWAEWLLILVSFAVFATVRSPIPGVNEPHYLTKSRHFWDPSWCSRDPFLQSANAHYVFYATVGGLTSFLSLEQTAALGRLLGWGLLATGWCALARQLIPFRWGGVWSAWVFLSFAAIGNWSGEWVVGGIEAKVLSYGCAWLSVAAALAGRALPSAAWAGAAVSFHPVVGIWNTAALLVAVVLDDWRVWPVYLRYRWQSFVGNCLLWVACAAPGLIPAVAMLRGANRAESYQADYIQVFYRLAHHLDPLMFSIWGYLGYAVLLTVSFGLYFATVRPSSRWKMTVWYVIAAVLIAAAGVVIRIVPEVALEVQQWNLIPAAHDWLERWIRYKPHLAGILKFYPFRLADVVIPWAASLLLTLGLVRLWIRTRGWSAEATSARKWTDRTIPWLVFGSYFVAALLLPATDRNPSRLSDAQLADWIDACHWVERETPRDALCFAAHEGWALNWYASRAEYLSHKDCPQDASGIVAWNERFKFITAWSNRYLQQGFSRAAIRELRQHTKIDYVIASKLGPFEIEPVYRNGLYQVYRLSDAER